MRYYYTHSRMAKIKRLAVPRTSEDVEQPELLYIAEGSLYLYSQFGKLFGNINKYILHNPAILFPGNKNECISEFPVWHVKSFKVISLS